MTNFVYKVEVYKQEQNLFILNRLEEIIDHLKSSMIKNMWI